MATLAIIASEAPWLRVRARRMSANRVDGHRRPGSANLHGSHCQQEQSMRVSLSSEGCRYEVDAALGVQGGRRGTGCPGVGEAGHSR